MRHLSQKDIIQLLVNERSELSSLRAHINQCPTCAEKFNRAQDIFFKKSPHIPFPSEKLLGRIISTYKNKVNQPSPAPSIKIFQRPALAALAAIFLVAITMGIYLMFGTPLREELVPAYDISATRIEEKKETAFTISAGDVISTKKSERVRILLEKRIDVLLYGDSILGIAQSLRDKEGMKRNIECTLSYGKIHARIIDKTGIRLSFKTPQGTITALATEFLIQVSADKTGVFLKEGTLAIAHLTGKTITLTAGSKCELSSEISTSPIPPGEFERILVSDSGIVPAKKDTPAPVPETSSDTKHTNTEDTAVNKETNSSRPEHHADIKTDTKKEIRAAQKESRRNMRHGNK